MKIETRHSRAAAAADKWERQYGEDKRGIAAKIRALGENPKPGMVNSIIGNPTWTDCSCDECGTTVDAVAVVGEEFMEVPARICRDCLGNALAELVEARSLGEAPKEEPTRPKELVGCSPILVRASQPGFVHPWSQTPKDREWLMLHVGLDNRSSVNALGSYHDGEYWVLASGMLEVEAVKLGKVIGWRLATDEELAPLIPDFKKPEAYVVKGGDA